MGYYTKISIIMRDGLPTQQKRIVAPFLSGGLVGSYYA